MDKRQIEMRIRKLRLEIDHHRYLYHVLDTQEISEAALDSLKNELFRLEQENPEFITPDSPTQRVAGQPLDRFEKAEHSERMISLFDAFSPEDMADWEKRNENYLIKQEGKKPKFDYYAELKLDGLAIALRYERSELTMGITRGDGLVGELVTQNIKTIESLPLRLRYPLSEELEKQGIDREQTALLYEALNEGTIEIRGEVIMDYATFASLNEQYAKEGKQLLANPRNGAAGSLRQLDARLAAERRLDFYAYDLVGDFGLLKQEDKFKILKLLGQKTIAHNHYCKNMQEVLDFHKHWSTHKTDLPFACDGLVIKVNNLALWPQLGIVGKGPRYMIAYKFPAEQATSKLLDVAWQVGRTGTLTPVAHLEPVNVGGATISHATLHNMDEIERLGLMIGDTIVIERAGDVIPKVVSVLTNLRNGEEKEVKVPDSCPICSGKIEKKADEVAWRCRNSDCFAVELRRLIHFASKGALDIEGLGLKVVEQLYREGLVLDQADFYYLERGDLLSLPRFAEKSADKLLAAIAGRKEVELSRFLGALGILHVGEETAIALARIFFQTRKETRSSYELSEIWDYFHSLGLSDWEEIPDVGPIVAKSLFDFWQGDKQKELMTKFSAAGLRIKSQTSSSKLLLEGKTIVVTGTLERLTRDELKDKIRELGGKVSSSVSKNTDFVVAGAEAGSKLDKAKELGVKVVGEEEFEAMIKI